MWSTSLLDESGLFSESKAMEKLASGTGHVTRIGGATVLGPAESAALPEVKSRPRARADAASGLRARSSRSLTYIVGTPWKSVAPAVS